MKKKLEELLTEFVKLDEMNRVCAKEAAGLSVALDMAIATSEATMFDLYAISQEETASQVHAVLESLRDVQKDVQGLVNSSSKAVVAFEAMVNNLIWMGEDLEDSTIEQMRENLKNNLKAVENTIAKKMLSGEATPGSEIFINLSQVQEALEG